MEPSLQPQALPGLRANPLWPLALPFVLLPLWWLLGLWQIMFFVVSIAMAVYLVHQRIVRMPRGFSIWVLWLAWLLTGLLVLQVTAPGTIPGINMNRYLVFAFRYGWYIVAAIFALYIVNTRHVLSTKQVIDAVSWLFVMLVAGGILGLAAPTLSFDSLFQASLPGALAKNSLVNQLTHVQTAQIHTLLGGDQIRPSAPFIYTNSWGFALSVSLPLFVASWWKRSRAWRIGMLIILVVGLIPVVLSLNRGMWLAIAAYLLFVVAHSAMRGNVKAILLGIVGVGVVAAALSFSPAGEMVLERFASGHSDQVRENLSQTAVQSTIEGSPMVL